ncbi:MULTISPECIES: hypothetical protein [Agrobacterium]|jgi:hypothetical protein|uniref:DUF883 domain-containing protein n=1 Tax=Agrobacterium rosae TaxID=1972867 RepID=A0AAE5RXI7_9HYPH|nr:MULTISPECIES: hypothetical protein [Agrobacterium]KAA3514467.1 hypothetical protein DXM21_06740 [Agrobacterium rosae]KAA3523132.1 hypothetical protein DXM25_06750 [Agrobacterium rosae]MBN7804691.1 hypothetical protein [Agrobacterium rosae]MCM2433545.1 hypothetical protein [Agrobacterium rosae]MDX8303332.1 hypothetical protein [Agrobacterium rosae]
MAQTKLNVVEDTVENQIAELRSQISSLSKSVSARAGTLSNDASEFVDEASGRLQRAAQTAAQTVKVQGHNVVEAVKENPGTATSVLTVVGALGFALGYFVATAANEQKSSSIYRWR